MRGGKANALDSQKIPSEITQGDENEGETYKPLEAWATTHLETVTSEETMLKIVMKMLQKMLPCSPNSKTNNKAKWLRPQKNKIKI